MKYANVLTGEITDILPTRIGATWNPDMNQLNAVGWRVIVNVATPTSGWVVDKYSVVETSNQTCNLAIDAQYDPVQKAAQELTARKAAIVARLTPRIKTIAAIYRGKLRGRFGANAEKSQAVGKNEVADKFVELDLTGKINIQTVVDFYSMDKMFEMLKEYTLDGTTWTFPWEEIPE